MGLKAILMALLARPRVPKQWKIRFNYRRGTVL